ncbi:hypothetical protein [Arthrobacter oryzae]|uniref:hypothetical protein n=1 Tax=Arthrobacter oryzae TaxID=409290 RepID=UPI00273CB3FF|nr:hypothetical protein [Arthrobacter oryzae]WLQ06106.1 hypothetical protein Q8Z05_18775 [Arthrobacter oryzae]
MSEYGHPEEIIPPPAFPLPAALPAAPSQLPAQASKAKSALRISAGTISIAVGFWGGSAALALHSMSTLLGPRFAWLGFLLGFAALCTVITGFTQIVRHRLKDLRIRAVNHKEASGAMDREYRLPVDGVVSVSAKGTVTMVSLMGL